MKEIIQAAEILNTGGVVSFPTETVYGLGARADRETGIQRIYDLKGRPKFNPLILHIAHASWLDQLVVGHEKYLQILSSFWPGPLTVVFRKKEGSSVSPLATAGLTTVAVRIPQHPLALKLLEEVGRPLVAPSANLSGRISPTQSRHVRKDFPGLMVLDGGAAGVGVESTIIDLTEETPLLLRPGGVTIEALENAFNTSFKHRDQRAALPITAPGQLLRHYAPSQPLRLNVTEPRDGETLIGFGSTESAALNLSESGSLPEAARNLFHILRSAEALKRPIAIAPIPLSGLGLAINDRLNRAAHENEGES